MREAIRPHTFKTINVTLANKAKWQGDAMDIIERAAAILDEYARQDITMTLRQLYYQLVARDIIPNDQAVYKKLSSLLTDARYAGLLDWDMMTDLTRNSERASQWASLSGLLNSAVRAYRKPRWSGQRYHVELLTEKEALHSVLKPIADRWHIFFTVNRGFNSATTTYQLAGRLQQFIEAGRDVVCLYIGDHDPSGLEMIRDMRARLTEILQFRQVQIDAFAFQPVALTFEQVQQYQPPENPAKKTDSRFNGYQRQFGDGSWEVDALRPEVMTDIVDQAIRQFVDEDMFNRVIAEEDTDKARLQTFLTTFDKEAQHETD